MALKNQRLSNFVAVYAPGDTEPRFINLTHVAIVDARDGHQWVTMSSGDKVQLTEESYKLVTSRLGPS